MTLHLNSNAFIKGASQLAQMVKIIELYQYILKEWIKCYAKYDFKKSFKQNNGEVGKRLYIQRWRREDRHLY